MLNIFGIMFFWICNKLQLNQNETKITEILPFEPQTYTETHTHTQYTLINFDRMLMDIPQDAWHSFFYFLAIEKSTSISFFAI